MILNRQPYKVVLVDTAEGVLSLWDFFVEGWQELCKPECGRCDLSASEFMKAVLRVATLPPEDGVVMLFTSKNDKPLGFMVVVNDSESDERRTALIYAGYSTGKYNGAPETAIADVETWARRNGYTELHAQSRRLNGASVRLFERKLGFKPLSLIYRKAL